MSEANQSYTSRTALLNVTGVNIIQLPPLPGFVMPSGATKVSEVLEIINFKARASIVSIASSDLPNFTLEDSETDRLMKSLDLEWKSPRKQLNLLISNDFGGYLLLGSISLLNTSGYPYRLYDLKQIYSNADNAFIGSNVNLAFQLQDVGYGLLTGDDRVDIWCDFVRTISYFVPQIVNVTSAPVNVTTPTIENNINISGGAVTPLPDGNGDDEDPDTPTNGDDEEMALKLVTADYQAVNRDRLLISTQGTTVTLPANPIEGTEVTIYSGGRSATIDFNGQTVENQNDTFYTVGENQDGYIFKGGTLVFGKMYSNELTWLPLVRNEFGAYQ